jgi:hypothetical protein
MGFVPSSTDQTSSVMVVLYWVSARSSLAIGISLSMKGMTAATPAIIRSVFLFIAGPAIT